MDVQVPGLQGVLAVPGDPALVSPASIVATEHSSAGVFVLPVVLFVVLLVLVRQHYLGSSGFGTTPCPERFGGPTRETGCHGVRNRSVG